MDEIANVWSNLSLTQRISVFKQILTELVIGGLIACGVFWCTLLTLWVLTYLMGSHPYLHSSAPIFHVQPFQSTSLVAVFSNENLKSQTCGASTGDEDLGDLPMHEFCNIKHEELPDMHQQVDIMINHIDSYSVSYVRGCIHYLGRETSCQKFPAAHPQLTVFRQTNLQDMLFLAIELQLEEGHRVPSHPASVEFYQRRNYLVRLFKDHYGVITLIFTYGLTLLITLAVICLRIASGVRKLTTSMQLRDSQTSAAQ